MRKHFAVQSEWDHSLKLNTKFTFYELQKINQIPNGPSTRTSHIAHRTQHAFDTVGQIDPYSGC